MNINNYMNEKDHITIPFSWCPTKFYKITFEGWNKFSFDASDSTFSIIVTLAAQTLDSFIKLYKDDYVFSEPQLCIKEDGTYYFKIGTLELIEYERRLKEKGEDDDGEEENE